MCYNFPDFCWYDIMKFKVKRKRENKVYLRQEKKEKIKVRKDKKR